MRTLKEILEKTKFDFNSKVLFAKSYQQSKDDYDKSTKYVEEYIGVFETRGIKSSIHDYFHGSISRMAHCKNEMELLTELYCKVYGINDTNKAIKEMMDLKIDQF